MSLRERSGARELNVDEDLVRLIAARASAALFEEPDAEADEIEREIEIDSATSFTQADESGLSDEREPSHTLEEVAAMIDTLNVDEQAEILALTYIGRGDYEPADLETAVRDVKAAASGPASATLFEIEVFPSQLEAGLDTYLEWVDKQAG
ncbi:hypothetical protein DLJ53_05680 [Acuticoccus sediminis]|uniref:DUF3775 domain-containing protein n=1 Tax=Acuticoccus sediminis TaxID=2184697 RepID=A0A8B2NUV2_9HYPH|nr:DUF3775 domain-containing protein [Acuticoccus sediminis]RAI03958.1 hypothetical protein DLJ53_05680 [Acuticoccus sediminis]